MQYYQASASRLSELSLPALARKVETFQKIHKDRLKFDAAVNGAKFK